MLPTALFWKVLTLIALNALHWFPVHAVRTKRPSPIRVVDKRIYPSPKQGLVETVIVLNFGEIPEIPAATLLSSPNSNLNLLDALVWIQDQRPN